MATLVNNSSKIQREHPVETSCRVETENHIHFGGCKFPRKTHDCFSDICSIQAIYMLAARQTKKSCK